MANPQPMIKSDVWGGVDAPITQGFGVYNSDHPEWYAYSKDFGLPYGTHAGLDIGLSKGTRIYSIDYGTVEQSGFDPNNFRPKPVYLKTDDNPNTPQNEAGYEIVFGHLWEDTVKTGDKIVPGQLLGYSGEQTVKGTMTPDGSGPHLHFELRQPGANTASGYQAIDPTDWLTGHKGPNDQGPAGAVLVPNNPDGSVPQNNGPTGDVFGIGALLGTVGQYAGRGLFILLGAGMLLIGLQSVMTVGSGGSGRSGALRSVRRVAIRAVPAGRVANAAAGVLVRHGRGPIQDIGIRRIERAYSG